MIAKWKQIETYLKKLKKEDAPTVSIAKGGVDFNPTGLSKKKKKELDGRTTAYKLHRRKLEAQREKRKKLKSTICGSFREELEVYKLNEAVDKKTAEWIIKNSTHQRFGGYNFEYYLSREMIDKMKQLKMKPPRGVSATRGGSLSELIKVATGKDVYLDGPSVVMGSKTIGKWKPTTQVGEILKMAGLLRQFQEETDLVKEDNIDTLTKIKDKKGAMNLKFTDGQVKVDLQTANMILQYFPKIKNQNTARKMFQIINKGKKSQFIRLVDVMWKGIK